MVRDKEDLSSHKGDQTKNNRKMSRSLSSQTSRKTINHRSKIKKAKLKMTKYSFILLAKKNINQIKIILSERNKL